MTTKRDKKDEAKGKRPKLKKETVRDLDAKRPDGIKGGGGNAAQTRNACT